MVKNYIKILILLISILIMMLGCSRENQMDLTESLGKIPENDLTLVNAYKRCVGHVELTEEDAKRMQEFPIYPNGKSRWDRVVDFVKSRHTIDDQFNVNIYESVPEKPEDQLDMVNNYYGELGGGFYSYATMQSYNENIYEDGSSQWQDMSEDVFDNMLRMKCKQNDYKMIPQSIEKQYDLIASYYREITHPSFEIYQKYQQYKKTPELADEDLEWKELVQYIIDDRTGNSPEAHEYTQIPQDLVEQIYMVNAWYRLLGRRPVTKNCVEKMSSMISANEKSVWQHVVEGAYKMSNGEIGINKHNIPETGIYYTYFEGTQTFLYYWTEYADFGDSAFDLSGERITANF